VLDLKGFGHTLLAGTALTIEAALLSLVVAVVLGAIGALAKTSRSTAAQTAAGIYTTLIRGVPDLVLMLLIFFGGQMLVNQVAESIGYEEYIEVSAFTAGVLTIGFIYGAYMTETFRGAILAVPPGQLEAGQAFGMSRWQVFREILLPQTIRYALPGFGNNWLVLLKTTALLSIIGLTDVLFMAAKAAGSTRQPFTFYLAAALIYLLLTTVSTVLLGWAERRAERPYRRPAHGH
jgi:arginine/ornithine transport system permease protein